MSAIRIIAVTLILAAPLLGCASGLDPDLAWVQTKPICDYASRKADEEADEMKREDIKSACAAWLENVRKARGDGDE